MLLVVGLVGCAGPRFVSQDQFGGTIAMPSNSDYWPTNYRSKAEQLMARKCPQGYHIEREEEVVVGQSATGQDSTDTQTQDLNGKKNRSNLQLTSTETTHSMTTHDITEYRISFRSNVIPGMNPMAVPRTPMSTALPATNNPGN